MNRKLLYMTGAAMLASLAFGKEVPVDENVPLEGAFVAWAPIRAILHLGSSYNTKDLSRGAGGLHHDYLADYGGETNQRPYPGLTYGSLSTHDDAASASLAWTVVASDEDTWTTNFDGNHDRNGYDKYFCIYYQVPGDSDLPIQFQTRHDDGLWVWNNGEVVFRNDSYDGGHSDDFNGVLHPGENCILFKFEEDGGGDGMQIKIGPRDNADMSNVTFSLYPREFALANPVTGSEAWISDNTLNVARLPFVADATHYQITTSSDASSLDDEAWTGYSMDASSKNYTVAETLAEGDTVTPYIWVRRGAEDQNPVCVMGNTLKYTAVKPVARAADVGVDIDPTGGTLIDPIIIDNGSTDAVSGIESIWVEPARLYDAGEVTFYVRNYAGLVSSAKANVTVVHRDAVYVDDDGDDLSGDGTSSKPFKTFDKAVKFLTESTRRIVIRDGDYNAETGWTFPLAIPTGCTVSAADGATVVIDADNAADHVVVFNGVTGATLEGVCLCNSSGSAVDVKGGSTGVVLQGCSFAQSTESDASALAVNVDEKSSVTLEGCSLVGLAGRKYVVKLDNKDSTFTARDCVFADNVLKQYGGEYGEYGHRAGTIFSSDANAINLYGCTFRNNTAPNGVPHDSCHSAAIYCGGCNVMIDGCSFVNNHGAALFGFSGGSGSFKILNTLLADNMMNRAMQCGYDCKLYWKNCTLVRNCGGYAGYATRLSEFDNCIFYKDGPASKHTECNSWNDGQGNPSSIRFVNTVRYDSDDGNGYDKSTSVNVFTDDPLLENPVPSATDAGFDVHVRPQSYVIDAADSSLVEGDSDLDGNARVADNNGDGSAVADLGCYESTFHAATVPTFEVPVPGSVSALRGVTVEVPVTISPAAEGEVTASIAYGLGVSGPETLTFESGSSSATLSLTLAVDCPTVTSFSIADAGATGVAGCRVDVYAADFSMTIGGKDKLAVREGDTRTLKVSFSLEGGKVPADVPFSVVVSGSGTSEIEWVGDKVISEGTHESAGQLEITGGAGRNTVVFTLTGGGTFVESGSSELTLDIVGYSYYVVKPGAGTDELGCGLTAENPFNTIAYALENSVAGDEIRILPGVYTSEQVAFPIPSSGRTIRGWNPDGAAVAGDVVFDGGDACDYLFTIENRTPSVLAGLTLRNSNKGLVSAGASELSITNCTMTQQTGNLDTAGAIELENAANVTAVDSVFTNMTRRAVIYCKNQGAKNSAFTGVGCLFEDNTSAFSTLAGDATAEGTNEGNGGVAATFNLSGCDFIRNEIIVGDGRPQLISDYYRSAILTIRQEGTVNINRCRFLANAGINLFGISGGSTVKIANTLFAGNLSTNGFFHGWNTKVSLNNCTLVGNSGGYAAFALDTTITDSIIVNDEALHVGSPYKDYEREGKPGYGSITLQNTVLCNTGVDPEHPCVDGSTDVLTFDPMLKNISVPVTNPKFAPRLTKDSQAVDASKYYNFSEMGDLDVAGGTRMLKNGVDLGAYEFDRSELGFTVIVR